MKTDLLSAINKADRLMSIDEARQLVPGASRDQVDAALYEMYCAEQLVLNQYSRGLVTETNRSELLMDGDGDYYNCLSPWRR